MATIRERTRSDGGTSYQVLWVIGGGRRAAGKTQATETFTSMAKALSFKEDVETAGHQWPRGWVRGEGYIATKADVISFNDVATAYFEHQKRRITRGRIKARTVYKYRSNHSLHLSPHFGKIPFTDITREDVEEWVDAMQAEGWAAKSIQNWHGVLYSIMKHGQQRLELRSGNPCDGTELPESTDNRQLMFFSYDEWATFSYYLKVDVLLLVDVLISTGMRWGEVAGLQVGDVTVKDDGDVVLFIQRAWGQRAPDDERPIRPALHETNSWILDLPKGAKTRKVVVTGRVADELKIAIKDRQPTEWLFCTKRGFPWRYDDFHFDRWRKASKLTRIAGLDKRFTIHMLRHTAVVWSLAAGVPIEKISHMLGHASIQITYDIYGGLLDLTDPEMARAMAKALAERHEEEVTVDAAQS